MERKLIILDPNLWPCPDHIWLYALYVIIVAGIILALICVLAAGGDDE